jgi:hypothetical protein
MNYLGWLCKNLVISCGHNGGESTKSDGRLVVRPVFGGLGQDPIVYESITMHIGNRDARWVTKKDGLSTRSWIACGGWTTILGTILLLLAISSDTSIQTLLALLATYVIQGCLVELIGVKIEGSGISFPNRVFPRFPYLVLFRRKLPRRSFDRVDFLKSHMLIIYPAMRQIIFPVTKRCDEKRMVRFLRDTFPEVSVKIMR